jgi:hypothetical protein
MDDAPGVEVGGSYSSRSSIVVSYRSRSLYAKWRWIRCAASGLSSLRWHTPTGRKTLAGRVLTTSRFANQAIRHVQSGRIAPADGRDEVDALERPIEHGQEAQLSLVNAEGAHRPPRVGIRRRRPAVPPARLTWLNARAVRNRRARRLSAVSVRVRTSSRTRDTGHRLPLGIELVRVFVLLALTVFGVTVALPALLELAAAPFH